jgi:tetrahydromethanopterin S-methyltransferase subunit A
MPARDSQPDPTSQDSHWPPLPGDFVLGSSDSPVAVCTLASQSLLGKLAGRPEIAIAGRVYTENVGIERMVQNLLASASIRYLLLCGRESRHRVGQAILSLHRNGLDQVTRRIRGATGPEPVLGSLGDAEIEAFRQRFELIDLVGEQDAEVILARAAACARSPEAAGPSGLQPSAPAAVETVEARRDTTAEWIYDPRGFFLIHVDHARGQLVLEHYDQTRTLRHRLLGDDAAALSQTAVRLGLLQELSHAAYLGRELAKAEASLKLGLRYEQDSPLRTGRAASVDTPRVRRAPGGRR